MHASHGTAPGPYMASNIACFIAGRELGLGLGLGLGSGIDCRERERERKPRYKGYRLRVKGLKVKGLRV